MIALRIRRLEEMTPRELYAVLKARVDVFVVEQKCPYPELDGKDFNAWHLWLEEDGGILAYLRALEPGVSFSDASLGRVCTLSRGRGLGARILDEGIRAVRERMHSPSITIEAQTYAVGFYQRAGFQPVSGEFLEDGIPHVRMTLIL